jgi:RNA-directed DNA polymerase
MAHRGLILSAEKTSITHIDNGFDFLGWEFRKHNGKLIIKPSEKSRKKVINTISAIIKENKTAKQETLIRRLNSVITGWSNYHQPVCSKQTFGKIDHIIFEMLWKWAKRRHPQKGVQWIKDKYWKVCGNRKWVFKDNKSYLKQMKDTPIVRYTPLILTRNAFTENEYFLERQKKARLKRRNAFKGSAVAYYIESGLLNA